MLLFLGERVNNRNLTPAKVLAWEKLWLKHGWKAARITEAMACGASRKRLDVYFPGEKHISNLLPPDSKPGTWDAGLAYCVVEELLEYLATSKHEITGIVLLGKRVSTTVLSHECAKPVFGELCELVGIPALVFPHPSGRNHFWKSPTNRALAKDWAQQLLSKV